MAIASIVNSSLIGILEQLQVSWPSEHRLNLAPSCTDLTWQAGHPLASQLAALWKGKPGSLPFFGRSKISWVTFGGEQEELLEAIEDLRAWVLPYLGREESQPIVTAQKAQRPQEKAFCALAGWYFRWYSPEDNFTGVIKRFKALSVLLESRPSHESRIPPSLSGLRLDFVAAVRTGEWSAAQKAVDLIDQWQLDTARNTQLMRIRMLYEEGNLECLIETIRRNELLDSALPSRVRAIVIDAVYQSELCPLERWKGWHEAVKAYERSWQGRLAPYVVAQRALTPDFSLSAYQAFTESDRQTLTVLFKTHNMQIAGSMLDALPSVSAPPQESADATDITGGTPPSISRAFWTEIKTAVQTGAHGKAKLCISDLTDVVLDDPEWISVGAETLLEIFTDPLTLGDPRSKVVAEEVLVGIVDTVINSNGFPRHQHAVFYDSLISTWVVAREDSSLEQDGQLLLGLVGAAIQCSVQSILDCEAAIRQWWGKRKILSRLPWLATALDTLIQNHANPPELQDLWIDGADLIRRHGIPLSRTERSVWRQLGRIVGLDDESVRTLIVELTEAEERLEADSLAELHLRKIAIVSLQEGAARRAAEELRSRTGADVVIVTSTAADDLTRAALSADLILFVWASCTHAVFRVFDHARDKMQYVQGTGPASIVLAAEHWAAHRQEHRSHQ